MRSVRAAGVIEGEFDTMSPTILVVDDDRAVHFIVSRIAKTVDFEIRSA